MDGTASDLPRRLTLALASSDPATDRILTLIGAIRTLALVVTVGFNLKLKHAYHHGEQRGRSDFLDEALTTFAMPSRYDA